jgi:hypothetical protein
MEISVRGWNRNMGTRKIADHRLSMMEVSNDPNKGVYFNQPGLFRSYGEVSVAWGYEFHLTGNYRVQVDFSRSDVLKLFKMMFGSELDVALLDAHGFTVSTDLQKRLISKMRLADLTIGDLVGLSASANEKKEDTTPETPATIKNFPRRI